MRNSWPLTPLQWAFANSIKESEIADLKGKLKIILKKYL